MDFVGSILKNLGQDPSVPIEKTKQFQWQKETNTVPCFKEKLQQFPNSGYKCGICGKSYANKKALKSHRNGHTRHKRKIEIEALNSAAKKDANLTIVTNESVPIKLSVYVDTLIPPVDKNNQIDNNEQSSTQQMALSDDQPFSDSNRKKLVPPKKKLLYNCNLCSRIFAEREKCEIHKKSHFYMMKKEALKLAAKEIRNLTNLTDELPSMELGVTDTPTPPGEDRNQSSVQQMITSVSQPSSTSDYCQKKIVLPEKKATYKCDICDRVFTKKKTYENHKTNHNYNRNSAKHLFFERGKGEKKST